MADLHKGSRLPEDRALSWVQPLAFKIVSNDGGEHSGEYCCDNMLRDDPVCFCSKAACNVNVLLKIADSPSFQGLTSCCIVSPPREQYTSPVNLGLLFVCWEVPSMRDLECWDGVSSCQEFEELLEKQRSLGTPEEQLPVLFLDLEHSTRVTYELSTPLSGRYVLLKFLRSTSGLGDNIDVQYVGFQGWCGPKQFSIATIA